MEKKKLNLKKEVVTTLTNENLRGGYDQSYYTTDKIPTMKGGCETGRCITGVTCTGTDTCTNTEYCGELKTTQCPETERCVVETLFCIKETLKGCFEVIP